jgi:hypothetical protein
MVTTVNDYEDPTFILPIGISIACHGLYRRFCMFSYVPVACSIGFVAEEHVSIKW